MIRIEQTTKARRKLFPSDEYCINKNGEYFYLTKVDLQKIACDLKLLGIANVVLQSEQLKCLCCDGTGIVEGESYDDKQSCLTCSGRGHFN